MPPTWNHLREIASTLRREVLAHIVAAVDSAIRCYELDAEHNDNAIFGFYLWRHLTNRLIQADAHGEIPLEFCGDGNDRAFKFGAYTLRFHRVSGTTLVPEGGEAAKAASREVAGASPDLFGGPDLGTSLLVGIVASPLDGLTRVTVGELVKQVSGRSERYFYDMGPADVYDTFAAVHSDEYGVAPEAIGTPVVTLKEAPPEAIAKGDVRLVDTDHDEEQETGTDA